MKAVKGQEKIYNCVKCGDYITLWNYVKYIGYKVIPSPNERRLIFHSAYKSFDYKKNNNFVAYYNMRLKYANLDKWTKNNAISSNKQALKRYINKCNWPTRENMKNNNQIDKMLDDVIF